MRGNSTQINKLRQEFTTLVNQGGDTVTKFVDSIIRFNFYFMRILPKPFKTGRTSVFLKMKLPYSVR